MTRKIAAAAFLIFLVLATQPANSRQTSVTGEATDCWQQLQAGMARMDDATAHLQTSGSSDLDFVRLMVPHHQAAIDMAKTELLCGKDPQLHRLAQEIITDQQQEIVLMQRWQQKENLRDHSRSRRD
jgi:uncharacterized protein (DUF305 family)